MENSKCSSAVLAIACCIGFGAPTTFAAPGDVYNLGALAGHNRSAGVGINASGQVVGTSYPTSCLSGGRAFRYDGVPDNGGVMHDLGTLGRSYSYGNGINDAGQVVGTASDSYFYHSSDSYGTGFRYDGRHHHSLVRAAPPMPERDLIRYRLLRTIPHYARTGRCTAERDPRPQSDKR